MFGHRSHLLCERPCTLPSQLRHYVPEAPPLRLRTRTAWSLLAQGSPAIAAVACVPILTRALGPERFGILLLVWTTFGMAGVADLGIGRSLTQLVATRRSRGDASDLRGLAGMGISVAVVLGFTGGLGLMLMAPSLSAYLGLAPDLHGEARRTAILLGAAFPMLVVASALRGVLEGFERFDLSAHVRITIGVLTFAGPALLVPITPRVDAVMGLLLVVRLLGLLALALLVIRVLPKAHHPVTHRRRILSEILVFGGWTTVSNVVSSAMVYADRFVIGSMISASAVAFYAIPGEIVTRLLLAPIAIGAVWLPAFARSTRTDTRAVRDLSERGLRLLLASLVPPLVAATALAEPLLRIWAGPEFAITGVSVLRWLALGVLFNGIAQIPFALLYARGRPKLVATLHLLELPVYVALLAWALPIYGIVGAGMAWAARSALDAAALFAATAALEPAALGQRSLVIRSVGIGGLLILAAAGLSNVTNPVMAATFVTSLSLLWAWTALLTPAWRTEVRAGAARIFGRR